ncbi:MAG: hypothetical protein K1X67_02525 [Fimbriimonadaceae bacterium]|nr:hypothetical protein [Fimbriimonadaceae bacterium]
MALRNERLTSIVFGFVGAGMFMTFYHAGPAMAQAAKNLMVVQPSTPGTAQSGHANITGTMKAGQFAGGGGGLTGLNASQITTGTLPSSALTGAYSNQLNFTNPANVINGNGAGLTNLPSSSLTGFISVSLLPHPFARLDAANVFGAFNNQFTGRVGVGVAPLAGTALTVQGVAPDWALRAQNTLGPTVVDIGGPNNGLWATTPTHFAALASGFDAVYGRDTVSGADGKLGTLGIGAVGTSAGGNEGRLGTAVAGGGECGASLAVRSAGWEPR